MYPQVPQSLLRARLAHDRTALSLCAPGLIRHEITRSNTEVLKTCSQKYQPVKRKDSECSITLKNLLNESRVWKARSRHLTPFFPTRNTLSIPPVRILVQAAPLYPVKGVSTLNSSSR